jgi:hypothetical protein
VACNIGMYPSFIKSILKRLAGLWNGQASTWETSHDRAGPPGHRPVQFAYLFGGLLARLSAGPTLRDSGRETDAAGRKSLEIFEEALPQAQAQGRRARSRIALRIRGA